MEISEHLTRTAPNRSAIETRCIKCVAVLGESASYAQAGRLLARHTVAVHGSTLLPPAPVLSHATPFTNDLGI